MVLLTFRAYASDFVDSVTPIIRFDMIEISAIRIYPAIIDTLHAPLPNMTFSTYDSGFTRC